MTKKCKDKNYRLQANKNYLASRSETAFQEWLSRQLREAIKKFWKEYKRSL